MTATEVKQLKSEVKKYIDHADERMVKAVYAMLEADQQGDWWDEIREGERQAVTRGLQQVLEVKVKPLDQVMEKYSKWSTK
jgi:hypothetical protein